MRIEPPRLQEVREAANRIAGVVMRTPLVPLHDYRGPGAIFLKAEIHQAVNSFKIRGVFNAVARMPPEVRARGLSTVSAGNTAQALAWTGRYFGVPARSVMPETAPSTKIAAVERYGGQPVLVPVDEVFRFLREHLWEHEPYAFVHPWTNRDVMIGHGTLALELVEALPELNTVYVPVGGGGLCAGVGSAMKTLKPGVRIVAVEPDTCPALHASLELDRPASVECRTRLCDGVAVPYITEEMFPILREVVDEVVLVDESKVAEAIRQIALGNRMIVEGSAALTLAAALETAPDRCEVAVCLLTGGSLETSKLVEILAVGD